MLKKVQEQIKSNGSDFIRLNWNSENIYFGLRLPHSKWVNMYIGEEWTFWGQTCL